MGQIVVQRVGIDETAELGRELDLATQERIVGCDLPVRLTMDCEFRRRFCPEVVVQERADLPGRTGP